MACDFRDGGCVVGFLPAFPLACSEWMRERALRGVGFADAYFTVVLLRRSATVMSMGGARTCLKTLIVFGYPFFVK